MLPSRGSPPLPWAPAIIKPLLSFQVLPNLLCLGRDSLTSPASPLELAILSSGSSKIHVHPLFSTAQGVAAHLSCSKPP